jgi:hypothetical protein
VEFRYSVTPPIIGDPHIAHIGNGTGDLPAKAVLLFGHLNGRSRSVTVATRPVFAPMLNQILLTKRILTGRTHRHETAVFIIACKPIRLFGRIGIQASPEMLG